MKWTRKELKTNARQTIRKNNINIIIVCFVIAVLVSGYYLSNMSDRLAYNTPSWQVSESAAALGQGAAQEIEAAVGFGDRLLDKLSETFTLRNATQGAIATVLRNAGGSQSFFIGLLNTINKIVFDGKILESTIIGFATVVVLLFWIFVQNVLLVGECRFFLETKDYPKSNVSRVLYIFRVGKVRNVAKIMFLKSLYILLWSLTIVGGVIKSYAYQMVPYILAENPTIQRKEAFALSQEMMRGNKWKAFKLDVSFVLWHLLSVLTLGVVGFVYVNPLVSATRSELYITLRSEALHRQLPVAAQLAKDPYLLPATPPETALYPTDQDWLPEKGIEIPGALEYDRSYNVVSLVYIFFATALIGWCWEVGLYFFQQGQFVNRGVLLGPWLPIYGVSSVLMIVILKPLIKKPAAFFVGAFALCGGLEYFTSWALEKLFNQRWWDYSAVFFNINGRVSLEGLLFFAIGGSLVVYLIAPLVDDIVQRIPPCIKNKVAAGLLLVFFADVVHMFVASPNQGENITFKTQQKTKK